MKKSSSKYTTIDEYLEKLPTEDRESLERLRNIIKSIVPDATEEISYQIPVFRHSGKYLVGFGASKKFCSFYVMNGSFVYEHQTELADYECTKSAIHFTSQKPLPAALVKKIVKARLEQNFTRAGVKRGKKPDVPRKSA
jgi:uncharacterized protein YdhG (YjbR/CyaY superfamily)